MWTPEFIFDPPLLRRYLVNVYNRCIDLYIDHIEDGVTRIALGMHGMLFLMDFLEIRDDTQTPRFNVNDPCYIVTDKQKTA